MTREKLKKCVSIKDLFWFVNERFENGSLNMTEFNDIIDRMMRENIIYNSNTIGEFLKDSYFVCKDYGKSDSPQAKNVSNVSNENSFSFSSVSDTPRVIEAETPFSDKAITFDAINNLISVKVRETMKPFMKKINTIISDYEVSNGKEWGAYC